MKRVKFLKTTGVYAKGAIATFPDEQADNAVSRGDAEIHDGIVVASDGAEKSTDRVRVIFIKTFKDGNQEWTREMRALLPADIAAKAIRTGYAREFPITIVGNDDKMVRSAAVK